MTATAAVLLSLSAEQLADVLAPAPVGVCGWLDMTCCEPTAEGDWLCRRHRAGMPHTSNGSADENAWYRQKAHEDDDHASCLDGCEAEADRLVSEALGGER